MNFFATFKCQGIYILFNSYLSQCSHLAAIKILWRPRKENKLAFVAPDFQTLLRTSALNLMLKSPLPQSVSTRWPFARWNWKKFKPSCQFPWNLSIFLSFVLHLWLVVVKLIKEIGRPVACEPASLTMTSTNQNEIWNIMFPWMHGLVKKNGKKKKWKNRRIFTPVMWNIWCVF